MSDEEPSWDETEQPWISIEDVTEKQEEVIREMAEEMGFENLAGLAGYMSSHGWDYYDVIKASCRE